MWHAGESGPLAGVEMAVELADDARRRGRVNGLVLASGNGSADELVGLLQTLSR
jgi:hypothetical protein